MVLTCPSFFFPSGLLSTPEARLAMACLRRMADPDDTLATAEIIALEAKHRPDNGSKIACGI